MHAVFVFVIMTVFLYIIINRIIFYDQCFSDRKSDSDAMTVSYQNVKIQRNHIMTSVLENV